MDRMLSRRTRRILSLAAVALAGCATGESEAPKFVGDICNYGKTTTETFLVTHINTRGGLIQNDVDLDEYKGKGHDQIPTALALPKRDRYKTEQRRDCFNEAGKYWYPCMVKVDVDLGPAGGFSRAVEPKEAAFYAVYNCERMTQKIAAAALKTGLFEAADLECKVAHQKLCPNTAKK
jgi:hypothetical protein